MQPNTFQLMNYFGIKQNPEKITRETFFLPESFKPVLDYLKCVALQDELAVLYGDIGSGKTTIIRKFIDELGQMRSPNVEVIEISSLNMENMSPANIMESLLLKLKCKLTLSQPIAMNVIRERLGNILSKYVVIIDEAHRLPSQIFVNIKQLIHLEWGFRDRLLSMILVGQPVIEGKIEMLAPDLYQRVRARSLIQMPEMSREEKKKYLQRYGDIFTSEALDYTERICKTPLDLNNSASQGMISAMKKGHKKIDIKDISGAVTFEEICNEAGITLNYLSERLHKPLKELKKIEKLPESAPAKQALKTDLAKLIAKEKTTIIPPEAGMGMGMGVSTETEKDGKNNVVSLHAAQ